MEVTVWQKVTVTQEDVRVDVLMTYAEGHWQIGTIHVAIWEESESRRGDSTPVFTDQGLAALAKQIEVLQTAHAAVTQVAQRMVSVAL